MAPLAAFPGQTGVRRAGANFGGRDGWLPVGGLVGDGAPGVLGAITVVHAVFGQLGQDECFTGARKNSGHLADSVFVMVANRLISPWSKRRTILEWVDADVQLPDDVTAPSLIGRRP